MFPVKSLTHPGSEPLHVLEEVGIRDVEALAPTTGMPPGTSIEASEKAMNILWSSCASRRAAVDLRSPGNIFMPSGLSSTLTPSFESSPCEYSYPVRLLEPRVRRPHDLHGGFALQRERSDDRKQVGGVSEVEGASLQLAAVRLDGDGVHIPRVRSRPSRPLSSVSPSLPEVGPDSGPAARPSHPPGRRPRR